ncbi:MAG TPA: hypothetical protein VHB21_01135, partial [Minicystis sp.]|nr:hypothetical protein [Minicystis sp.]
QPPRAAARHAPDEFPRRMRQREIERIARRRVAMPAPDAGAPAHLRDPMLAALPPGGGKDRTALVFEAEALKSLPVGRMFLRCMQQNGRSDRMEQRLGVRPEQVERVAVSNDVTILGGDFSGVAWPDVFPDADGRRYGGATIYDNPNDDGQSAYVAALGDGYVLAGRSRAEIEAAIDRMEGRSAETAPAIPDDEAYGEVYGKVGVEAIARILDRDEPELADRLRETAEQIDLHADATSDVLLVSDVTGADGKAVADLGKAFGGALAVGRMGAKSGEDADQNLAELLENARVRPRDDAFGVEVALPLDLLERALGPCAKEPDGGAP